MRGRAEWDCPVSGGLRGAAADCPYEIMGDGVEQAGDAHLAQTAQDHAAEAAVLHSSMHMLGVTAAFVDLLSVLAVHARAPILQTLRLGGAIAFVPGLAFR